MDAPVFLPYLLTVTVRIDQLAGPNTGLFQLLGKAKFGQLAHRMGQHIDADAEGSDLRHRFKYGYLNPGLMQAKRRRQPADTAARDQDMHDYEPDSFIRFAIICSMISLEPPPMAPTFMSR